MKSKETYHDLAGDLVEILYGFHYHHDENDQPHSAYCYDREGRVVEEEGEMCSRNRM